MSTKNSTEDKLIASIQKTRSGGAVKAKPKAAPKKAAKNKAVNAKTRAGSANRSQKQALIDVFQYGRRVWPD